MRALPRGGLNDVSTLVDLTPGTLPGDRTDAGWPVPATDPPILIPAIRADDTLYPVEKIEAHVKGLHHLAISVFLFARSADGDRLLLQRRAKGKYHCGGQWANTCCTHPHWEEDPADAAARRLHEELGIRLPLQERRLVDYCADMGNGLWERERVHMFRAEVDHADAVSPAPNPAEVSDTRWVRAAELRDWMRRAPGEFTPWFRLYVNRFPALDF